MNKFKKNILGSFCLAIGLGIVPIVAISCSNTSSNQDNLKTIEYTSSLPLSDLSTNENVLIYFDRSLNNLIHEKSVPSGINFLWINGYILQISSPNPINVSIEFEAKGYSNCTIDLDFLENTNQNHFVYTVNPPITNGEINVEVGKPLEISFQNFISSSQINWQFDNTINNPANVQVNPDKSNSFTITSSKPVSFFITFGANGYDNLKLFIQFIN